MAGELLLINPRRRKRRSTSRKRRRVSYAHRNPIRRRSLAVSVPSKSRPVRRRRRRFSSIRRRYSKFRGSSAGGFLTGKLFPASVGAAGALALDLAWPQLPLPDSLKTGPAAYAVRIGGAVAVGYAAKMVGGARFGNEAMGGALVVTLYDMFKGMLRTDFPNLPMAGVGAFVNGYDQLGWFDPAQQVGEVGDVGAFVGEYG